MKKEYLNYGTFEVTTEADCEGRSVRHLGTFTGYIDEIAFALADKCYYSLRFSLVNPKDLDMTPKCDTVDVSLDIDSGTWDMKPGERVRYFKELLKDRDVEVLPGKSYASCVLTTHKETIEEKKSKNFE